MSIKYISIIFDDGPREPMCQMIDKIASFGFSAGFAVVGNKINDQTEEYLKYAIDRGFELVGHGQNHIDFSEMTDRQQVLYELMQPINEIKKRLGYQVEMVRLPYIKANNLVFEICAEKGIPLLGQGISWVEDWLVQTTPERIATVVLNSISDGAIGCLHVTQNTCDALDIILPELKKRGYCLVTAKDLFKFKNTNPIPLGINITNANLK